MIWLTLRQKWLNSVIYYQFNLIWLTLRQKWVKLGGANNGAPNILGFYFPAPLSWFKDHPSLQLDILTKIPKVISSWSCLTLKSTNKVILKLEDWRENSIYSIYGLISTLQIYMYLTQQVNTNWSKLCNANNMSILVVLNKCFISVIPHNIKQVVLHTQRKRTNKHNFHFIRFPLSYSGGYFFILSPSLRRNGKLWPNSIKTNICPHSSHTMLS